MISHRLVLLVSSWPSLNVHNIKCSGEHLEIPKWKTFLPTSYMNSMTLKRFLNGGFILLPHAWIIWTIGIIITNIILTIFEPLMVNLCSFVKVLDYFHIIMFSCFKLQIFKSTVILQYSHTLFLRVEGLGVPISPKQLARGFTSWRLAKSWVYS